MASCRTIKGKTYRLEPTEGKCQRGRPKGAGKQRSVPPAARGVQLPPEVEEAIARGVLPDEAEQRRRHEKATRPFRTPLRSSDLRVLEREDREREHRAREAREREQFAARAPERSSLAGAGRLPKREPATPALKSTERAALDKVRKRNRAGLLYSPDATTPTLRRMLGDLAQRGHVREHGHGAFYMPEFASDVERLSAASARLAGKAKPVAYVGVASGRSRSDYDVRRQPVVPLPPSIDPSTARVGDHVSVFNYLENEPAHGTLTGLPGELEHGHRSTEPTIHFLSGSQAGMNRYIRWDRVFKGWLDPNVNWKPWKG